MIKGWFASATMGAGRMIANKSTMVTTSINDCIDGHESVYGVIGTNARKCRLNGDGTYNYV